MSSNYRQRDQLSDKENLPNMSPVDRAKRCAERTKRKAAEEAAKAKKKSKRTQNNEEEAQYSDYPSDSDATVGVEEDQRKPKALASKDKSSTVSSKKSSKSGRSTDKTEDPADEIARLKRLLALEQAKRKAQKKSGRKGRKTDMTKEEREWYLQIRDACKKHVWHVAKFINSDKKLDNVTRGVMDAIQPPPKDIQENPEELAKYEAKWVAKNRDMVRQCMNQIRNYFQGQIRQEYVDRKARGRWVPTADQILDCLQRAPYLFETEEGNKIWDDYVDTWLYKALGKHHWDKNNRYTKTVSLAKHEDRLTKIEIVNEGTEAFVYLCFQNGVGYKWPYIAGEHKKGRKADQQHDACRNAVWTISDGGQMEWGGWTNAARKEWRQLKEKCAQARQQDHVEAGEEARLKAMRIANGWEQAPDAAQPVAVARRGIDNTSDDDDDEFANIR